MGDLAGSHILVTSGPTRARIDAVRFISSTSTGKLGAAIATEALARGARVLYVHGPGAHLPSEGNHAQLRTLSITWLHDLHEAARQKLRRGRFDAIVHAMAVLDYAPQAPADRKTRSGLSHWDIALGPTPKLLPLLREWHPNSLLVGFKLVWAAAREQLLTAAEALLTENRLQLVVANDLSLISDESHPAVVLDRTGVIAAATTKAELAQVLVEEMSRRIVHE